MTNGANGTSAASLHGRDAGEAYAPHAAGGVGLPELEELRGRILEGVCGGDVSSATHQISAYGAMLKSLADGASTPDGLRELATRHEAFFEQLRALLIASRIEARLELERVKASRQYSANSAGPALGAEWRG